MIHHNERIEMYRLVLPYLIIVIILAAQAVPYLDINEHVSLPVIGGMIALILDMHKVKSPKPTAPFSTSTDNTDHTLNSPDAT